MVRQFERNKNRTLSDAISVSLGLQEQDQGFSSSLEDNNHFFSKSFNPSNILSKSFNDSTTKKDSSLLPVSNSNINYLSTSIHPTETLHRRTAEISNQFNYESTDSNESGESDNIIFTQDDHHNIRNDEINHLSVISSQSSDNNNANEFTHLLQTPVHSITNYSSSNEESITYHSPIPTATTSTISSQSTLKYIKSFFSLKTLNYVPASILGLLLNILDALSYGMILFPITDSVFTNLGPTGISMFYISTIISQIVYSGGLSAFPSALGGEMIEIVPFFHTMALSIKTALDNNNTNDQIITTTIFCFVISSIITGLVFFGLGRFKLGKLVGFFPRHILIGCIGGVGYFLLVTGVEVTTRIKKLQYSPEFLFSMLTSPDTMGKLLLPISLSLLLNFLQKKFTYSLLLPSFYIVIFLAFHFFVAIIPSLDLNYLRETGWIFKMAISNEKWYSHYKYFNFSQCHWNLVLKQIPTMLALTFFGILHVPINVPALAMSLKMDKYDVDKELIAHGYSNLISGLFGSIQNYLVYTNSVLFIRAGADSPVAGFITAIFTGAILVAGPIIISFIPVCVVGSLIFLLGWELIDEALFDTWGKVTKFEYITIMIIVFTMGIFDFVLGILVGVLIACFSFLVDSTKLQTINGEFDGTVAKSTVCRDYVQTKFLNGVSEQIYVLKLQNVLFFGTIISIEEKIDRLLEISDKDDSKKRIKYLILDLKNINSDNIDYSAAEGFNRIKRFTKSKNIQLIISSIKNSDRIYKMFNNVDLLDDIELFNDMNGALEWCENELLFKYGELKKKAKSKRLPQSSDSKQVLYKQSSPNIGNSLLPINTPRNNQMMKVARSVFKNVEQPVQILSDNLKNNIPILELLILALKQYRPEIFSKDPLIRDTEIKFWSQLCKYFEKVQLPNQTPLKKTTNFFFLVESGALTMKLKLKHGDISETMSTRTCYGRILGKHFNEKMADTLTFTSEAESIIWLIDEDAFKKMRKENVELFTELTTLIVSIKDDRFRNLLNYALVSA